MRQREISRYAIALGSNRRSRHGSPAETLCAALRELSELADIRAVSTIWNTPALGPAGRGFANAVAMLESPLAPDALLDRLKRIEREFGRRGGRRWGPRVLDLDIILWSGGAWGGPGPTVPHPQFRKRAFVLQPLAEVAAGWRDPITGLRVRHLLFRLTRPCRAHR